jgi:hypothetical protein
MRFLIPPAATEIIYQTTYPVTTMMHSSDAFESHTSGSFGYPKKTKKRSPTDDLSASFGFPVNKKRGGLSVGPEPKTNKLKSPYSFDAGCTIAVPRNKAPTIARV